MKAVLFSLLTAATLSAADQPNVILIMSDDMGYSDLGCYGGEIDTPNLDSLASAGLRFTQFYNTARCCPTRAALLTGLYPHQAGIGHMMEDKGLDAYRGELSKKAVTIAEAVKPAGYRAYMVGKWHVTKATTPKGDADKHNWPLQRGFDRFYGTIHGAGSFFDPNTLTRDNQYISPFADPEYQPEEEYYYTDAIAGHASRFIADHARDHSGNPFFMYVAFTAAHWPMHAKEKDIAKYKGRYDEGYDAIRAARVEKMRKLGLIDPRWQTAAQAGGAWNDVQNREFEIRCMEVYAAMIDSMDQGIGRMIAELKRSGQYDNTLILFFQDNGGCAESMGRKDGEDPAARASNPTLLPLAAGYLQPDMIPKQTRDGFPMRQGYGVIPGGADTYHGYGEAWANVSNTPFREYKHWVHEGGISTPLIAHWPKGIPSSRHGALEPQPAHLIDLMATCVDLASADYPKQHAGETITPLEGVSLRPAFGGESLNRPGPIFFEHEGNRAVRDGEWKLVAKGPRSDWELYDMATDRTEQHNLASKQTGRVQTMAAQWENWARHANVIPWIWGPPYGAAKEEGKSKGGKAKAKNKGKAKTVKN